MRRAQPIGFEPERPGAAARGQQSKRQRRLVLKQRWGSSRKATRPPQCHPRVPRAKPSNTSCPSVNACEVATTIITRASTIARQQPRQLQQCRSSTGTIDKHTNCSNPHHNNNIQLQRQQRTPMATTTTTSTTSDHCQQTHDDDNASATTTPTTTTTSAAMPTTVTRTTANASPVRETGVARSGTWRFGH